MNEQGYIVISLLEIVNEMRKKFVILLSALQYIDAAVKGSTLIDRTVRIEEEQQISKTQL
jgi:hypothetical protein